MNRKSYMTRRFSTRALLATILICSGAGPRAAQTYGAQGPEDGTLRRQDWLVPSLDRRLPMRAVLYRPAGPGPFPLAVINHGSSGDAAQRATYTPATYSAAAEWFVQRGYAVAIPLRPGHGATGGPYLEGNSASGRCADVDYRRSGLNTAGSIAGATEFLTAQPFIKRDGVVVVGQSAGGWGALALASRNPRYLKAVINFAGGRGGHVNGRPDNNCFPDRLIEVAHFFGSSARVPVLSLYTENDSFFAPQLSKRIADAYRIAGGNMDYRLLPAFGREGHLLLASRDGIAVWGPLVEEFLRKLK